MRRTNGILNACIFVVCLLIVITCYIGYLRYNKYHYNGREDYLLEVFLDRGNYASLTQNWRDMHVRGRDEAEKVKPLSATAEYIEAASLYHVYEELGDTEHAAIQWQRMEDAAGRMGEYSGERAKINARLGITE